MNSQPNSAMALPGIGSRPKSAEKVMTFGTTTPAVGVSFGGPPKSGFQTPTTNQPVSPSLLQTVVLPKNPPQNSTPGFTLGLQPVNAGPSLFGQMGTANPPSTPSNTGVGQPGGLFGGNPATPTQAPGGLFGAPSTGAAQPGLFGGAPQPAQAQPQQGGQSLMGKPPAGPSLFGGAATQPAPGLFGGTQAPQGGLFGTAPKPPGAAPGLFGSAPSAPSLFPGQQPAPSNSMFPSQQQTFGPTNPFPGAGQPQGPGAPANVNHFQSNRVFVFNNFQGQGVSIIPTISGYIDFASSVDQTRTADFAYLYMIPKTYCFALSTGNHFNNTKISDLEPVQFQRIKAIDTKIRDNQNNIKTMKASIAAVGDRATKLSVEATRSAALNAKDLNSKIEHLHQQFKLVHSEFDMFKLVVHELGNQVPAQGFQYTPRLAFPSKGLQLLSHSLTDKLECINTTLNELIVFLEGSIKEEGAVRVPMTQYIQIIEELFDCVKILHLRNQRLQGDMQHIKKMYYPEARERLTWGKMKPEVLDDAPSSKTINDRLSRVIERTK